MSASDMDHPEPAGSPNKLAAMPGARGRAIFAAAISAGLLAIAGCGGDSGGGDIPQDTADSMLAQADEIRSANEAGDCEAAQTSTTELRNEVATLDGGETKQALDAMVTRLDENLDADCVEEGTSPDPETEEPVEEEAPVEPAPVPEETAPTEEETEPAPEEEEEPAPPEQPAGEGGGPDGPAPGGSGGGGTAPPTGGVDEG